MEIEIYKLNKNKGGTDFSYNDASEIAIINAICYYYDLKPNGGTTGNDPRYDKIINNTKIEIKVSAATGVFLEIAKADDTPSGIFTSEADVYMTLNPGYLSAEGRKVIKVRLYHKQDLLRYAELMLTKFFDQLKVYPASAMGPGSQGFMLPNKKRGDEFAPDDLFVLGFDFELDKEGRIVFDTHKVINRNTDSFVLRAIRQYIK